MTENAECKLHDNMVLFESLNKAKKRNNKQPDYWLLSDLSACHPQLLKPSYQIPVDKFANSLHKIVTQRVPAFETLIVKPVHLITVSTEKQNNNSFDTLNDEFKPQENTDQQLSRLACEYLFKQYRGAEFTQAYFLFPDCNVFELTKRADDIKTYRDYQWINNIISIMASVIMRVTSRSKASVYDALKVLWSEFLDTQQLDELKQSYQIEHSPLDHIQRDYWKYLSNMFNDVLLQSESYFNAKYELELKYSDFQSSTNTVLDLEDIRKLCRESAKNMRHFFEKYYTKPEELLSNTDFSTPAREIDTIRKQFWFNNYTKSL